MRTPCGPSIPAALFESSYVRENNQTTLSPDQGGLTGPESDCPYQPQPWSKARRTKSVSQVGRGRSSEPAWACTPPVFPQSCPAPDPKPPRGQPGRPGGLCVSRRAQAFQEGLRALWRRWGAEGYRAGLTGEEGKGQCYPQGKNNIKSSLSTCMARHCLST